VYIYNSSVWAAAKTPASNASGLHAYPSARIPNIRCSETSPVPCGGKAIAGSIVFLGQDSSMDVYIITTGSIYRVIPPSLCASGAPHVYTITTDSIYRVISPGICAGGARPPAPPQKMPPWLTWLISILVLVILVAIPAISWLCGAGGAGQPTPNWSFSLSCCSSGTTN